MVEMFQLSVSFRVNEDHLQGGHSEPKKRTYRVAVQSQRRGLIGWPCRAKEALFNPKTSIRFRYISPALEI